MSARINPQSSNVIGEVNQDSIIESGYKFYHGHVQKVVLDANDLNSFGYPVYGAPSDVSQCVLLSPTDSEDINLPSDYVKKFYLAQPLLRGFADSISRGDSVLYTQIGSIFFYLGPLNTLNNPNYSPDHLYNPNLNPNRIVLDDRKDDENGYNINFVKRAINKVNKIKNILLDRPYDTGIGEVGSDAEVESNVSDLTLEGRHGNSFQLGYRFINPYSIIKNNNLNGNNGSIIGLLSLGRIPDYFDNYNLLSSDRRIGLELETYPTPNVGNEYKYPGYFIGHGNDAGENTFNMSFGQVEETAEQQTDFDQVIMFSDRITFDAQNNDFTVSAFRNINLGAGRNITITNKGFTVIESQNIYIGKESKNKAQPMVLGDELRIILLEIMTLLKDSRALVQGVPTPMVDATSSPILPRIQNLIDRLQPREIDEETNSPIPGSGGGTRFLSQYHYLEQNIRGQE